MQITTIITVSESGGGNLTSGTNHCKAGYSALFIRNPAFMVIPLVQCGHYRLYLVSPILHVLLKTSFGHWEWGAPPQRACTHQTCAISTLGHHRTGLCKQQQEEQCPQADRNQETSNVYTTNHNEIQTHIHQIQEEGHQPPTPCTRSRHRIHMIHPPKTSARHTHNPKTAHLLRIQPRLAYTTPRSCTNHQKDDQRLHTQHNNNRQSSHTTQHQNRCSKTPNKDMRHSDACQTSHTEHPYYLTITKEPQLKPSHTLRLWYQWQGKQCNQVCKCRYQYERHKTFNIINQSHNQDMRCQGELEGQVTQQKPENSQLDVTMQERSPREESSKPHIKIVHTKGGN